MMTDKTILLLHVVVILISIGSLFGQIIERGDPDYRRKTNIDINKVRATIFNYGITGRSGVNPDQYPYEWPTNSGQTYIALTG